MLTPGPKRIILIRAGRYDYAEVMLGNSTHLVGQNNAGKTSLIATLQMLYVANFNEMSFSRPWDESRRYYFRHDTSTILFETATSDGRFVTVGLRGRGQLGSYQVDRFAYEGAYRRDDFISEDNRVRPFDEVKTRFAGDRFFKSMEPGEIRSALVGELNVRQLNMGIVPLRDVGRYSDFVYLFKNLLRLNDLSQKDIKETFLTVYRHGIRNAIEVDLYKEYNDSYSALMAEKAKLLNLRQVAHIANHLKAQLRKREGASRDLPALYATLVGAKGRQLTALLEGLDEDRERQQALEIAENASTAERERLEAENNGIVGAIVTVQQWISEHETDALALRDFLPDMEEAKRNNLDAEISKLIGKLVNAGDPTEIEGRLGKLRIKLAATIEQRDKYARLLGSKLQARLGQEVMIDLARIFHPGLLRLPVEDGAVTISDEDAILAMLRRLQGKVTDGRLLLDGIAIPLDQIASRDTVLVADLATLNDEIEDINRQIEKLEQELNIAKNMATLQDALEKLKKELATAQALHASFVRFVENTKLLMDKRVDLVAHEKAKADNYTARKKLEDERFVRSQQKTKIINDMQLKQKQLRQLDNIRPIPVDPNWAMGTADPDWPDDPFELDTLYSQTYAIFTQATAEVLRILDQAEIIHPDGFGGNSQDEKIEGIIEAVDSLDERDRAYRDHLGNVIKGMRATFHRMFGALDGLRESADGFSRTIGNVSISNLRGLSVKVVENFEVTRHYRSVAEAGGAADLLTDLTETESAISAIFATIQRTPILRLADWFGVQFVVKTVEGTETLYNDLSVIESNGTTMAIKTLVNIVLIRAMMRDRRPFMLPFYIDEANQIDEGNLREILALANDKSFCPILASTVPVAAAESIYMVRLTPDNRAVIDPKWRIERKAKVPVREDNA